MQTPAEILGLALKRAVQHLNEPLIKDAETAAKVDYVSRNLKNRAGVRLLLACALAKTHRPEVDIRKPYTEIGTPDSYSGRTYDETYVGPFVTQHQLPCNSTTAFLTPALRNRNIILAADTNLVGNPPQLYETALQLLDSVHGGKVEAHDLLAETIRCLLIFVAERQGRMSALLAELKSVEGAVPLSAECIVSLIEQHLKCRGASRLPVLVVAAAYSAAAGRLGERSLPLQSHNAADEQTHALGDVEITLVNDEQVITSYEMKFKRVLQADIDRALQKVAASGRTVDNYIFITTDKIDDEVQEYAASVYEKTGGMEFIVLDCVQFLRHFLHLFHRLRIQFLQAYQELLLAEPESAVSQPLKEAFLALRQAAESAEAESGE